MNPLQCDRGVASRQSFYLQTNFVLNIPYYQSINYQRKKKRALPSFSQKKKEKKKKERKKKETNPWNAMYSVARHEPHPSQQGYSFSAPAYLQPFLTADTAHTIAHKRPVRRPREICADVARSDDCRLKATVLIAVELDPSRLLFFTGLARLFKVCWYHFAFSAYR